MTNLPYGESVDVEGGIPASFPDHGSSGIRYFVCRVGRHGRSPSSAAQRTMLTGRMARALENRTGPSTLSVAASLIQRTPGIVVSKAFWAFPASVCNGWARLWGLAQGREWRRRKTCESSAFTRAALRTAGRAMSKSVSVQLDQRGRLQSLAGPLLGPLVRGKFAQLLVNQGLVICVDRAEVGSRTSSCPISSPVPKSLTVSGLQCLVCMTLTTGRRMRKKTQPVMMPAMASRPKKWTLVMTE